MILVPNTLFYKIGIDAFIVQLNEASINSKQVKAVGRKDKQFVASQVALRKDEACVFSDRNALPGYSREDQ